MSELAREKKGGGTKYSTEYFTPVCSNSNRTLTFTLSRIPKHLFVTAAQSTATAYEFSTYGGSAVLCIEWDSPNAKASAIQARASEGSYIVPTRRELFIDVSIAGNQMVLTIPQGSGIFMDPSKFSYQAFLVG